ncbi:hypothetical protein D3C87_2101210 [compost metagenome]
MQCRQQSRLAQCVDFVAWRQAQTIELGAAAGKLNRQFGRLREQMLALFFLFGIGRFGFPEEMHVAHSPLSID